MLAFAQGAKLYNLTRPQMTEDNILQIESGRHILKELLVSSYVPNDTDVAGGSLHPEDPSEDPPQTPTVTPSILILTGPNQSGKSVYMRQVALIVFLAHTGSFVPAARATIGRTDKILTCLACSETVSKAESAFTMELQQCATNLSLVTPRSLFLVDEFGKGTAPEGRCLR